MANTSPSLSQANPEQTLIAFYIYKSKLSAARSELESYLPLQNYSVLQLALSVEHGNRRITARGGHQRRRSAVLPQEVHVAGSVWLLVAIQDLCAGDFE